jgi:hypothetical protein
LAVLVANPASSMTLSASDVVTEQPADCGTPGSDPCVLVEWLDASIDISVDPANDEVTLVLTNTTGSGGDPTFNLNELYFSASDVITSLSLVSSTHSVDGPVTSWSFYTSSGLGGQTQAAGFGVHDFALKTKSNKQGLPIASGDSIAFVLGYSASSDPTVQDFAELSQPPSSRSGQVMTLAAVKFVQGSSSSFDLGGNDSAYGGIVPEPRTAVLLCTGLAGLAVFGRRRGSARR